MEYTVSDFVLISLYSAVGTSTLGLGLFLLEELEPSLAIWVYLVSSMVFALNWAFASRIVNKIRGKRTELGKEVDELRERIDALERGVKE